MTRKLLLGIHQIAIGLLPVALCFWYYQNLTNRPVQGIYFTYTDALVFVSDALALVAVIAWLIAPHPPMSANLKRRDAKMGACGGRTPPARTHFCDIFLFCGPARIKAGCWGLALCLLASLSILWSTDWRVSLYVSLHWWLVFGVFLSIQDRPELWKTITLGFCAALVLQTLIGFWQFGAQSTVFLWPLGLTWPGELGPATSGASVVQLSDGIRWLRAYGTFPHPNMLGGFALAFLAGPWVIFLLSVRGRLWAIVLSIGGAVLLVLTFSRSAWLGLVAAALLLFFQRLKLDRKHLLTLALATLGGITLAAAPLYTLIFTRVGGTSVATEAFSNKARVWLIQESFEIIKDHPALGVGIGTYILEYARRAPYGYLVEPVHNLPLLVLSELGIAGALILVGLGVSIGINMLRARRPETVIFSAMLAGLLVTSLFDHYLWTLTPGRMLLGIMLGLWAAQAKQDIQ